MFQHCTDQDIKTLIKGIADKIGLYYAVNVVSVCTGNVSNFRKAFLSTDNIQQDQNTNDDEFMPLDILNVNCSCHTAQLVLKDLYECDTYYQKLVEILKGISLRISYLSKRRYYNFMLYAINRIDCISQIFSQVALASFQLYDLLQLQKELTPIYAFTTLCEAEHSNQESIILLTELW